MMSEHNLETYLDECKDLKIGDQVKMKIETDKYQADLKGVVTDVIVSRYGLNNVYRIEILDFGKDEEEYFQILYDRIPTLPQSLRRDYGMLLHLWRNIAIRLARDIRYTR